MPDAPPTPLPFATKSEWAYGILRKRIVDGSYKPGDRLRLTEIARELGISEMPVREALRMLGRDRLVVMESHRGATVIDLTLERAFEIIAVRTHLELLALEDACGRHAAKDLDALEALSRKMAQAVERGDPKAFSEVNRGFHRALYAPGPNQTLKAEIEGLWDRLWLTRDRSIFAMDPDRMESAQAEHELILAALRRGDAGAALAAAARHRLATLRAWSVIVQASTDEPRRPQAL